MERPRGLGHENQKPVLSPALWPAQLEGWYPAGTGLVPGLHAPGDEAEGPPLKEELPPELPPTPPVRLPQLRESLWALLPPIPLSPLQLLGILSVSCPLPSGPPITWRFCTGQGFQTPPSPSSCLSSRPRVRPMLP